MNKVYSLLSFPFMLVASILIKANYFGLKDDLNKCLSKVVSSEKNIPPKIIEYLIAAEDHRFYKHSGVDFIGIARSIFVYVKLGKVQGASTIEQQFIRTITGNYQKTLSRKLKEQILAFSLSKVASKNDIATAYILNAYYGHKGSDLIKQTLEEKNYCIPSCDHHLISTIARLKYPKPKQESPKWIFNNSRRIEYIKKRHKIIFP